MMKRKNWNKGFTLAELLVVVAISIPIFITQHNKAVDAVNKSNIRAAKSMAATALYDSSTNFIADVHGTTNAYFTYSDGKFERITGMKPHQINNAARTGPCTQAKDHKKCSQIYVYVSTNDKTNFIQTAPCLDQDGNINQSKPSATNPFG